MHLKLFVILASSVFALGWISISAFTTPEVLETRNKFSLPVFLGNIPKRAATLLLVNISGRLRNIWTHVREEDKKKACSNAE